jgi:hypothetical protein
MQASTRHIEALSHCRGLEELSILHYVAEPGPFAMEEFAALTALRKLELRFEAHGNKQAPHTAVTPGLEIFGNACLLSP